MKKILAVLTSFGLISTSFAPVIACATDKQFTQLDDPKVVKNILNEVKKIDYSQTNSFEEMNSKVAEIIKNAIVAQKVTNVVSDSVSVKNYYYFNSFFKELNQVITSLDADEDNINDLSNINYVIEVGYQESSGHEILTKTDLIYVYNQPLDCEKTEVKTAFESAVARTILVNYSVDENSDEIYRDVMSGFVKNFTKFIKTNENLVGFNGGFLNEVDATITITDVEGGKTIENHKVYTSSLTSGLGLLTSQPIQIQVKFELV